MARPVEQPVTLQTPPTRTVRRSISRGDDIEGSDFRTALRGADQKKAAAPAEEARKPEATKKPAANKLAGKPGRAKKRQDQTVSADEQPVEGTVTAAADATESHDESMGAQMEVPEGAEGEAQTAPAAKDDPEAADPALIDPAAVAASVPVVTPQQTASASNGETPDDEAQSESTPEAPAENDPLWASQTPRGPSSVPSKAGVKRESVGRGMQAATNAGEQQQKLGDHQVAPPPGLAIVAEMEPADEEVGEVADAEPQVAKVEMKAAPVGMSHGLSIDPAARHTTRIAGPASAPAAQAPEVQFAEANHDTIVTAVRGQLLPDGGQMRIRLDPPELGALWVRVQVQGGTMTASFETSNEQATRALSHSLSQLKIALEASGVTVDKLQVAQAPKGQDADLQGQRDQQQQQGAQDFRGGSSQRDQQRQELIQKMWEKIALGRERVDLKA